MRVLDLNSGSLEEQPLLLAAGPSLQSQFSFLRNLFGRSEVDRGEGEDTMVALIWVER